jgi:hypothetical protein
VKEPPSAGPIREGARRVAELHARVHATCKLRDTCADARTEWKRACEDFHRRYDGLAFPGGYEAALEKIKTGDAGVIADALAFVEIRPYFFRSQYMWTKLTRLLKRAPLSTEQADRFLRVLEAQRERTKQ